MGRRRASVYSDADRAAQESESGCCGRSVSILEEGTRPSLFFPSPLRAGPRHLPPTSAHGWHHAGLTVSVPPHSGETAGPQPSFVSRTGALSLCKGTGEGSWERPANHTATPHTAAIGRVSRKVYRRSWSCSGRSCGSSFARPGHGRRRTWYSECSHGRPKLRECRGSLW